MRERTVKEWRGDWSGGADAVLTAAEAAVNRGGLDPGFFEARLRYGTREIVTNDPAEARHKSEVLPPQGIFVVVHDDDPDQVRVEIAAEPSDIVVRGRGELVGRTTAAFEAAVNVLVPEGYRRVLSRDETHVEPLPLAALQTKPHSESRLKSIEQWAEQHKTLIGFALTLSGILAAVVIAVTTS